jgi:hypothetical protein
MAKRFDPTDKQRGMVEMAAAIGFPHDKIARLVDDPRTGKKISARTLARAFPEELANGAAKAHFAAGETLFKLATGNGDWEKAEVASNIFYCKTRMGYRERDPVSVEVTGKDGGPIQHANVDLTLLTDEELAHLKAAREAIDRARAASPTNGLDPGGGATTRH